LRKCYEPQEIPKSILSEILLLIMIRFFRKSTTKKDEAKETKDRPKTVAVAAPPVPISPLPASPKTPRKKSKFLEDFFSLSLFGGFSQNERINFFHNLAAMLSSGISIVDALGILKDQVKDGKVKKAIQAMADDTKNGRKISEAMAKFPKYFADHLVETVNTGDVSGRLTETLDRIADDLEKDDELKKKVQGALAYPIVLMCVMVVVAGAFAFYILPTIGDMFSEINAPLPLPTKIILSISGFLQSYPFVVLGVFLGIVIFFFLMFKIKQGRYVMHYLILRLPIFGELIKQYNLIFFFRSLGSLFSSGVSLVYAVDVAKKTVTNDVYRRVLDGIYPLLLHGTPLTTAIEPFPFFFSKQTQKILWVGEKTGKVEEALSHITAYYERSVDYKTRMLTVLIEPVLMVIIGIVVGALALSIFMPLYGLIRTI